MAVGQTFSMLQLTPLAVQSAPANSHKFLAMFFHVMTVHAFSFFDPFSFYKYDSNCVTACNLSNSSVSNHNGRGATLEQATSHGTNK